MSKNDQSLLPINVSKLLKDLEKSGSRLFALGAKNKDVFDIDKLAIDILPWLAWSFSVDSWNDDWSELVKRAMVKNSIAVHRIKGTKKALKHALEIIGVCAEIEEWWETEPRMAAHSFNITAYLNDNFNHQLIINLATQQKLINLINNVKPVRAHFNFKLGVRFINKISYATILQNRQFINLGFVTNLPLLQINPLIFTRIKTIFYKQVTLYV